MGNRPSLSVADRAKKRKERLQATTRQSTDALLDDIKSGKLVDRAIEDLKKHGKNEFGDPLRWQEKGWEECLRFVADLRIGRKYVSGASQRYKGHPNDEWIWTTKGKKRVGDVSVGDYFISPDGSPTQVKGVHPLGQSKTFKVSFKDGTSCVVTDEHLWTWYSPGTHSPSKLAMGKSAMYWTSTTEELYYESLNGGGFRQIKTNGKPGRYKYAIPRLQGYALFDNGFDCEGLSPYLLGLLIGDGSYTGAVRLTGKNDDLLFYSSVINHPHRQYEYKNRCPGLIFYGLQETLRTLGIFGQSGQSKRIPEKCFGMSWEKRLDLLRGLMDSDGSIKTSRGKVCGATFVSVVPELAEGVATLVRDLGGWAVVAQREHSSYKYVGEPNKKCVFYTVTLSLSLNPFKLPRKAQKYAAPQVGKQIKAIVNIEPWEVCDCTCFTVDHPTSLYLVRDGIITHNTASCAQINAYFTQRAGLRGLWSFPKARTLELLVPKQHRPLLRRWAKVSGVTKITRDMLTSNAQFDVGLGSATYTHVNSGQGEAAAGTSVVAVTADFVFVEEASQSSHAEIMPLYRRVDASRIPSRPVTWLGTPGGGGGIEVKIQDSPYEFWPHAYCPHCSSWSSLHPLGALLKSKKVRGEDGSLMEIWAHEDGTPIDWYHHSEDDPIKTAYIACVECGKELSDQTRSGSRFKCIKTGLFLTEFLDEVVPVLWEEEMLEAGLWVGSLSRPRKGLATEIMEEMSPESIEDWYQQKLGIPSSAMANCVTKDALINACRRPKFVAAADKNEKSVILMGIDQGRAAWYGAIVEFIYNPFLPPAESYAQAKRNVLALEAFPYQQTNELIDTFGVAGGLIDNEPSIALAAQVSRNTGLKLADQQAKLKDDYKMKLAQDGGEQFSCFSIKYKKFARAIFSIFNSGNVSVENQYLRFAGGSIKSPGDVFKHLTRVEWDSEKGDVVKAKDGVDDLFFALMFAEAAFGIYLVNPGVVASSGFDWGWMDAW